jgi:hypothetical protein
MSAVARILSAATGLVVVGLGCFLIAVSLEIAWTVWYNNPSPLVRALVWFLAFMCILAGALQIALGVLKLLGKPGFLLKLLGLNSKDS